MTKSELINRLAGRNSRLSLKDAEEAVKSILEAMSDARANGQRVEVRGFGSFVAGSRPPRIGRNPKSGEAVTVPEKRVAQFKTGKQLRMTVDAIFVQAIVEDVPSECPFAPDGKPRYI